MRGTVYPAGGLGPSADWLKWSVRILLMHPGFWPRQRQWRGTPLSSSTIWSASSLDKPLHSPPQQHSSFFTSSPPPAKQGWYPHLPQQAPRVPLHHSDHEQHGADWRLPGGAEPRTTQDWHMHHGDGGRHLLPHRAAVRSGVGGCRGAHGQARLRHDTLVPLHFCAGDQSLLCVSKLQGGQEEPGRSREESVDVAAVRLHPAAVRGVGRHRPHGVRSRLQEARGDPQSPLLGGGGLAGHTGHPSQPVGASEEGASFVGRGFDVLLLLHPAARAALRVLERDQHAGHQHRAPQDATLPHPQFGDHQRHHPLHPRGEHDPVQGRQGVRDPDREEHPGHHPKDLQLRAVQETVAERFSRLRGGAAEKLGGPTLAASPPLLKWSCRTRRPSPRWRRANTHDRAVSRIPEMSIWIYRYDPQDAGRAQRSTPFRAREHSCEHSVWTSQGPLLQWHTGHCRRLAQETEQCCIQIRHGAKYSITCDFVKAFPRMISVNCVFFLIVQKGEKKATTARLEDIYIFELCVLHSNLKLKGSVCCGVYFSVARMFLVVGGL